MVSPSHVAERVAKLLPAIIKSAHRALAKCGPVKTKPDGHKVSVTFYLDGIMTECRIDVCADGTGSVVEVTRRGDRDMYYKFFPVLKGACLSSVTLVDSVEDCPGMRQLPPLPPHLCLRRTRQELETIYALFITSLEGAEGAYTVDFTIKHLVALAGKMWERTEMFSLPRLVDALCELAKSPPHEHVRLCALDLIHKYLEADEYELDAEGAVTSAKLDSESVQISRCKAIAGVEGFVKRLYEISASSDESDVIYFQQKFALMIADKIHRHCPAHIAASTD
jgi:hypothetical protein